MPEETPAHSVSQRGAMRAAVAVVVAIVVCLCAAFGFSAEKAKKKVRKIIIARPDGSRTPPVHRIQLFAEGDDEDRLLKVVVPKADGGKNQETPACEPFSTKATCNKCHEYGHIAKGWHFNALSPDIRPGRKGEPWILVDRPSGTQIPLSSRKWPGTFRPAELGLSQWRFTQIFGRQMPGGGIGEVETDGDIDRSLQSGRLQINCMGCHNAKGDQDQSAWAVNVGRYNYQWAATAACGLAEVTGDVSSFPAEAEIMEDVDHPERKAMAVSYFASKFSPTNKVTMDLRRNAGNERCYSCHSSATGGTDAPQRWETDGDVHIAAGLSCVDCHRNGESHHITRGYEGEVNPGGGNITTLSCQGCHLGQVGTGPLAAPYPKHKGLPEVHLLKMSCTACHSGPKPRKRAARVKTSRAHGLGVHEKHTGDPLLPYIASPVFVQGHDGKIAPHHALWPAYWAMRKDGKVTPIPVAEVLSAGKGTLPAAKKGRNTETNYTPPTPEQIAKTLAAIAEGADDKAGQAVYVCGGKLYKLSGGKLVGEKHKSAEPYLWAFAHDVRPAGMSLGAPAGAAGCDDCHATDSPTFFGEVVAEAPAPIDEPTVVKMYELRGEDGTYWELFARSFVFRPMLKIVGFASSGIIGAIVLLYAFLGLKVFLARIGWRRRQKGGEV